MIVRTTPRPIFAELVRIGDEIAVCPVLARHKRDETCDCPMVGPKGESRQQRHCATRHLPVRGMTFLEHNLGTVTWCRVINVRAATEPSWFSIPRLSLTVMPYTMNGGTLPLARFVADQRDPMVIRERVTVEQEGQPTSAGITCNCPKRTVPGTPLRLVPDIDATQVLASSLVPVGVQTIPLTGEIPTKGYAHQHDDTAATLDFVSERESRR